MAHPAPPYTYILQNCVYRYIYIRISKMTHNSAETFGIPYLKEVVCEWPPFGTNLPKRDSILSYQELTKIVLSSRLDKTLSPFWKISTKTKRRPLANHLFKDTILQKIRRRWSPPPLQIFMSPTLCHGGSRIHKKFYISGTNSVKSYPWGGGGGLRAGGSTPPPPYIL